MLENTIEFVRPAKAKPAAERWTVAEIAALFELPFNDLMFRAQSVHREHFNPNEVQVSTLLSIKTGGCSEDCGYCPQSARYHTGVENEDLMALNDVVAAAKAAKDSGAQRFCMGAAWRGPNARACLQRCRGTFRKNRGSFPSSPFCRVQCHRTALPPLR